MDFRERIRSVIAREMGNTASESVRFLKNLQAKPKLCLWGLGSHGYNWRGYLASLGIHADYVYDASAEARAAWIGTEHRIETRAELTALLPEMAVLVTMRNAAPVMDELRALSADAYVATVNFFSFDTRLRYAGHPEMLRTMEREVLVLLELCADDTSREIVCQTIEKDFDEAHVDIDSIPDQYFVPGVMPLTDEECFVDVGAYDGDTMDAFLRAVHGNYRHIYAFEMSRRNFAKLSHKVTTDPRCDAEKISLYPYGCSDMGGWAHYYENATSSVFADDGPERAEFRPLDEVLGDAPVTLIKMDIEGAEPLALRGAEQIIRRNAPKLAICTYHRAEHLWEIPALIGEMNPAYRFYFRHHDPDEMETVCYAVI